MAHIWTDYTRPKAVPRGRGLLEIKRGKRERQGKKGVKVGKDLFYLGYDVTCLQVSVGSRLWEGMWLPWQQVLPMCDIPEFRADLPNWFLMPTLSVQGTLVWCPWTPLSSVSFHRLFASLSPDSSAPPS